MPRRALPALASAVARLRREGVEASGLATRRTMNRAGAYLWGAGAVIVVASVVVGLPRGSTTTGVLAIGVLAVVMALILRLGQDRVPQEVLPVVVALGSLAITALMWFDGSATSPFALLYVWAGLYAFYFFSFRSAMAQLLLIAVLSGLEIAARGSEHADGAAWMLIVSTVAVAGMWVHHLVTQVRHKAVVDGLTGVANRLHLAEEVPRLLERTRRAGGPLVMAMLDLDNFKAFNDEAGHLAGDEQLRRTVAAWQAQLRPEDVLIRYGGEEFLVVLPGCHAVEALARSPASSATSSVEEMFVAAQRLGLGTDLDWAGRRAAMAGARELPDGELLFVNTSLASILSPVQAVDQTLLLLRSVGRDPRTVVLEITEREVVRDPVRLTDILATYRAENFRFALDDVGEGLASLLLMSTVAPEYIKLARSIVVTLHRRASRAAAQAVLAFAREIGAQVIAEGIETEQQVDEVRSLGIQLGQGYLLGIPAPAHELLRFSVVA